jgi:hypothetical protein
LLVKRVVLVEFLGSVSSPDSEEKLWLVEALRQPSLEARVLTAIQGNSEWFEFLASHHLPRLMAAADFNSGHLLHALGAAWGFARQDCLRLVRQNWLHEPSKDPLTFQLLYQLPSWDELTVEVANRILSRTRMSRFASLELVTRVSESLPAHAPRLLASILRRELEELNSSHPRRK